MTKCAPPSCTDIAVLRALDIQIKNVRVRLPRVVRWCKPCIGWVKLNVDGSCRGNPGNCGGGGVIRDNRGFFKAAFSSLLGYGTNNMAELKAIILGIKLCKDLRFFQVEIACDSALMVQWINSGKCSAWYLWEVWEELVLALTGM